MPDSPTPNDITFLIVGCQRCGTTWVDAALREHPQIFLPPQKQTYFFDRNLDKGLEWWLGAFAGVSSEHRAVGEVATGYCLPDVVPHMAEALPHIQLIMAMRNPVDRAYSNFTTRQTEMGWRTFEEAIDSDLDLLERGEYITQIEAILQHYQREKLLLTFYEDLAQDDRAYLRAILEFLNVDPDFESSQFGKIRNSAMFPRLRRTMDRIGLRPVRKMLSQGAVGDMVRANRKRSKRRAYKPMNPETRRQLVKHFQPFNERLEALAGRNLSNWSRLS